MPPRITIGRKLMYAALVTPGNARTSDRMREYRSTRRPVAAYFSLQRCLDSGDARRFEAGVDGLDAPQRANEQPRRDEQDHRGGYFRRHQEGAQPLGTSTRPASRSFAETGEIAIARYAQRGHDAEPQARGEGGDRGEDQNTQIDGRGLGHGERRRHEAREQGHGDDGDRDAEQATDKREHEALGQQLAHEPLAPRAERGPHRQLLAPLEDAREEQAREVRAGDEQHTERGAGEPHEHQAVLRGDLVPQRVHGRAGPEILFRVVALELLGDDVHLRLRRLERHLRFEPGQDVQIVVVAIRVLRRVELERRPHLRVASREHERRRHDADDEMLGLVQAESSAKHVRRPPNSDRHDA